MSICSSRVVLRSGPDLPQPVCIPESKRRTGHCLPVEHAEQSSWLLLWPDSKPSVRYCPVFVFTGALAKQAGLSRRGERQSALAWQAPYTKKGPGFLLAPGGFQACGVSENQSRLNCAHQVGTGPLRALVGRSVELASRVSSPRLTMRSVSLVLAALAAAACISSVHAVDRSKFRTCQQTGFCRRHRAVQAEPQV